MGNRTTYVTKNPFPVKSYRNLAYIMDLNSIYPISTPSSATSAQSGPADTCDLYLRLFGGGLL